MQHLLAPSATGSTITSIGTASIRLVRNFPGPNVFLPRRALWLSVTMPAGARSVAAGPLAQIGAVLAAQGLTRRVPQLAAAGGDAVPAATVIAHLAIDLQCWVGHEVSLFARAAADSPAADEIVLEYELADVALRAMETAAKVVYAVLLAASPAGHPQPVDNNAAVSARIGALLGAFQRRQARDPLPDFIAAARARGIPWRRPLAQHSFYELGQGHKLRRLWRHFTPATAHLATVVANHKHMASALLRANGLPVPKSLLVDDADAAVRAAHSLGLPVVVKPDATDFGTAVSVELRADEAIRRAFEAAHKYGKVLVEQMIVGSNHRLLVMHGRFVSAVRQTPAQVVGDGVHSIRALVEEVNRTRADTFGERWKKIALDEEADTVLRDQQLGLADVVASGRVVRLRYPSNLSVGGTMENVTALVHPDNQELAVRAAAVVGLDVAGIDFVTSDIGRSHSDIGGAICEINPTPGFTMAEASGRLAQLFIEGLYASGDDGRVPIVVLVDDTVERPLLPAIESLLAQRWPRVGVATAEQVRIGTQALVVGQLAGAEGVTILLADPRVEAVLVALTTARIVEQGLAFDRCTMVLFANGRSEPMPVASTAKRQDREAAVRLLSGVADHLIVDAQDPALGAIAAAAKVRRVDGQRSAHFIAAVADALQAVDATG